MDEQYPQLNPYTLTPALNPTLVVDGASLDKLGRYLSRVAETSKEIAWDYETTVTPTFFHRRARTLQIGDQNEQYVIDLLAFAETPEALYSAQGLYRGVGGAFRAIKERLKNLVAMMEPFWRLLDPVVNVIRPFIQSNRIKKLGHNLEFEYTVSKWCLGMRPWHFYDSQVAERLLLNGAVRADEDGYYKLADVVRKYCKVSIDKTLQMSFDLSTPLTEEQIVYCALDCRLPFPVRNGQMRQIVKHGLERTTQIRMDAIPAFGDMHLNGLGLDCDAWLQIMAENEAKLVDNVASMDSFFVPIVGRKVRWDDEEIERKRLAYEELKEKSEREVAISAEMRTARRDPERMASLKGERDTLEAERVAARTRAKEDYYAERSKGNAAAREAYSKMEGEAAINYNASGQLLDALHKGGFGLNKQNFKDTNDKSMERHADKPVVKAIRAYRGVKKQLGTYGTRWLTNKNEVDRQTGKNGYMDSDTGRIHSTFWQLGADTGRPSSTNPNVLNLPKDDRYRAAFKSRPGMDMVDKDCAGQELRILTEYSKEQAWIEAFLKKQDVHSISAFLIRPSQWKSKQIAAEIEVVIGGKAKKIPPCAFFLNDAKLKCACPEHKEMRDQYKAVNFGIAYDKQAYSLAIDLGVTQDEAQEILDGWKSTFNTTAKCLEKLRETAYEKGEARDLSGFRRLITKVSWEQAKRSCDKKFGEGQYDQNKVMQMYHSLVAGVKREAGNLPIQGTGASMMNLAMGCGFDPEGKPYMWHILEPEYDALLENYIYDEFLAESPEEHSHKVSEVVSDAIIRAGAEFVKVVPMESEGGVFKRWQK